MKTGLSDSLDIETHLRKTRDPLRILMKAALEITGAEQVGLVRGTDGTKQRHLPPETWDRGIIDRLGGKGYSGFLLPALGRRLLHRRRLSPVLMYSTDALGNRVENQGIIAYVLRNYSDFYQQGIRVLVIPCIRKPSKTQDRKFISLPILSFDGFTFQDLPGPDVTAAIIRAFYAENFMAVYVPDYGALVLNTVDPDLLSMGPDGRFSHPELTPRLNRLIQCIETASISLLGRAGRVRAADMLRRKEQRLRTTAARLSAREADLDRQRTYLMAVGAVTETQLTMQPVFVDQGVYAFTDMVGSGEFRKDYTPGEYFLMTNLCRQIAANAARQWSCRLGNFIGDGMFFENVSPFDPETGSSELQAGERAALMILMLRSFLTEISVLSQGAHPMDPDGKVAVLLESRSRTLAFRCGIDTGPAIVGPVGSAQRMIVTSIGEGVDNASRLESTGIPDTIHMSCRMFDLLHPLLISDSATPLVKKGFACRAHLNGRLAPPPDNGTSFFAWYEKNLVRPGPMAVQRTGVHYKEFSCQVTWQLSW